MTCLLSDWGEFPVSVNTNGSASRFTRTYALNAEQARGFLRAAQGDPLEAVYVVALRAGLRESELLGLHLRDVDLEAGTLTVRSALVRVTGEGLRDFDPKTASSARLSRSRPPSSAHSALTVPSRRPLVRQLSVSLVGTFPDLHETP
jgi:integrase